MGDPVTLRWYEIDHKKAVKKTRTAIRHTTAIMRKQISADLEDLDVRTKPIRFEYVFSTETLGLGLGTRQRRRNGKNNDKDDHGPTVLFVIVTDITNPKLISDNNRIIDDNVPEIGDIVISVDGNKLDNNGVKYATNLIRKAGRPLAILFERKQLKQIEIELKQHIGMRIAKEFYNEELKPTIYFGTVDYISNIVNQWAKIRFDDGDEEDFGNECVLKGLEMYKQYKHLDPYSEDKVAGSPIDSECANVATTFTSRKTNKYRQQLHLLSTTTGCAVDADDVNDNDVNKDNGEQGIIDSIVPTKTQKKKLKLLKPNRTNTNTSGMMKIIMMMMVLVLYPLSHCSGREVARLVVLSMQPQVPRNRNTMSRVITIIMNTMMDVLLRKLQLPLPLSLLPILILRKLDQSLSMTPSDMEV